MKKLVSLLLTVVMLLGMTGAVAETAERVTLTVAMPVNAKVEDIDTNQLTLWIEEKLNIDLEFIQLNTADTATQVNMLMTSGDLPDVVTGYSFPYDVMCSYADAGLIIPIDDLVEKYATEDGYKRFVKDFPAANPEAYVTYDGHKYAVPAGGAMVTNVYNAYGMRIQGKFLENLGYDHIPTTLEEFYSFLVDVRDKDANGDGNTDDEIPYTSATHGDYHLCVIRNIGNAYQYTDTDNYVKVNDGTIEFVANNDLYKEMVLFLKKLVDENLLDPAAFTQDAATLASRQSNNPYTVGAFSIGYYVSNVMDTSTEAYKYDIASIFALEGPYGYKATGFQAPTVRRSSVITSACENPEVAFKFLDFLLTEEGSTACRIGFEGTEWRKAEEGELGRNGEQAKYVLLKPQEWIQPSTNVIWCTESSNFAEVMNYVCDDPNAPEMTIYNQQSPLPLAKEYATDEYLPPLLIEADDVLEYNELKAMITDYVSSNTLLFALGDKSMDEWDAYCAELETMGLSRYIEMTQAAYDKLFK